MPQAAPRPCTQPGCGALVHDGSGRCDAHQRKSWAPRYRHVKRIRGSKLKRLRDELLHRKPLCEECERNGRVSASTVRDHIVPLAEGGTEDESNIQALCDPCHDAKSKRERIEAARRERLQGC